jgi:hypothetical protein
MDLDKMSIGWELLNKENISRVRTPLNETNLEQSICFKSL